MSLKRWLHVIAALLGLGLAALIVFLVFGQASEQGSVAGDAPGSAGREDALCGSVNAARGREAGTIKQARSNLPTIINEDGVEVTPRDDQAQWFARLQASSGLCIDEVVVLPQELRISASYPGSMSGGQLDAFAVDALARAFEPPLARTLVRFDTRTGSTKRTIAVRSEAWSAFQTGRAPLGLDRSVAGLRDFAKRTGYDRQYVNVAGW